MEKLSNRNQAVRAFKKEWIGISGFTVVIHDDDEMVMTIVVIYHMAFVN